jgi:hypothetical protein
MALFHARNTVLRALREVEVAHLKVENRFEDQRMAETGEELPHELGQSHRTPSEIQVVKTGARCYFRSACN